MKKIVFSTFALIVLLTINFTVVAHSGRTDSQGGHTDHSTGSYHFHHGYSAHQHTDMDGDGNLDCPYEFKTNCNTDNGDSSANIISKHSSSNNKNQLIIKFCVFAVCVVAFCEILSAIINSVKLKKQRKEFSALYGNKSSLELSKAPLKCYVRSDGLPAKNEGWECWGNGYTFYKTAHGTSYHKHWCKFAKYSKPINAYHVQLQRLHSCSICKPNVPDLSWYYKYREIEQNKKKYKIH